MRIIQSFAQFDEGSPYMIGRKNNPLLNYYSFLLSYLTLNKYAGDVTMFCNQKAYNSFIKYIPYDNLEIRENDNNFVLWNGYKIDVMKSINEDFIHVDSDVFIFNKLFEKYKNDPNYQLIIQDIIPKKTNAALTYYYDNEEFLKNNVKGLDNKYDGRCVSCGVFGMKTNMQGKYYELYDFIYDKVKNKELKSLHATNMILEEMTAYLTAISNNFNIYDVLPHDLVLKYGLGSTANRLKYTHMWFNSKFNTKYVNLVKNKIKKEFPDQYHLVEKFDRDVFKK